MRDVERLRSEVQSFEYMPHSSPDEYSWTARTLLEDKKLRPVYLAYHKGHIQLAFDEPKMLWYRIFEPNTRSYRIVEIRDATGSFEHQWRAGLYRKFGLLGPTHNPTGPDFAPKLGEVKVRLKAANPHTQNLLDYFEFEFHQ